MTENKGMMKKRPPIVVVLGHVDHGKTSLLDYLRKTKIAEKEAGGITQSIGAYEIIHMPTNREQVSASPSSVDEVSHKITFIDTPGHEAFRAMRQRGAAAADIAILVVAANEGVKPQTEECLKILKETETPYLIAITKIDLPKADVERVKNDLLSHGVQLEGYGGDISWQPISSRTGEGINELLDLILLLRDLLDLKYNPSIGGRGFIIESKKDPRRGIVASVILKDGALRRGQDIATPTVSGKIKILENFAGKSVDELWPSSPALIVGFEDLPQVGEKFIAGNIAILGLEETDGRLATEAAPSSTPPPAGEAGKDLPPAILRADVAGSLEVLIDIFQNKVKIIDAAAGEVTDGDIKSAAASQAIVIGFRTRFGRAADVLAKNQNVPVFLSEVIYELDKAVEDYLNTRKAPEIAGRLKVLAVFGAKTADRQIIGGKVLEGKIKVGRKFEIVRNNIVLGDGKIINLQLDREDVQEVEEGKECGLLISAPVIIKTGDEISQGTVK